MTRPFRTGPSFAILCFFVLLIVGDGVNGVPRIGDDTPADEVRPLGRRIVLRTEFGDQITGGVLDHKQSYAYLSTSGHPCWLLKVDLVTMAIIDSLQLAGNNCSCALIDLEGGWGYFGSEEGNHSTLSRIDLKTKRLVLESKADVPRGYQLLSSGVLDLQSGWAYISAYVINDGSPHIARFSLTPFGFTDAISFRKGYNITSALRPHYPSSEATTATTATQRKKHLYFGTSSYEKDQSDYVLDVLGAPDVFYVARKQPLPAFVRQLSAAVSGVNGDYGVGYFATAQDEKTMIVKVRLEDLEILDSYCGLNSSVWSAIADPNGHDILFATQEGIIRFNPATQKMENLLPLKGQKSVALVHPKLKVAYTSNNNQFIEVLLPGEEIKDNVADTSIVRCIRPMGGIYALIPGAAVYTIIGIIGLCVLGGYLLHPVRKYSGRALYMEAPVILWSALVIICAFRMAAFFLEIARAVPSRYVVVSTIFLVITYFFYIVALLWAFLSWVTTVRKILLEDPAATANRNLRRFMKLLAWIIGLFLLTLLILVVTFSDEDYSDSSFRVTVTMATGCMTMAAIFLVCFFFFTVYGFPLRSRLSSEVISPAAPISLAGKLFWWILLFSLMCVPMALLSPSTSRVSVAHHHHDDTRVHCDTPVLVSAIRLGYHGPKDNLLGFVIDVAAQITDILCILVLFGLGWHFFRLYESDRRVDRKSRRRKYPSNDRNVMYEGNVQDEADLADNSRNSTLDDQRESSLSGMAEEADALITKNEVPYTAEYSMRDLDIKDVRHKRRRRVKAIACGLLVVFLVLVLVVGITLAFYFLWPRYPTWQIKDLKFDSISFNRDFSLDIAVTVTISFDNENYLRVKALDTSMSMTFHNHSLGSTPFPVFTLAPRTVQMITMEMQLAVQPEVGLLILQEAIMNEGILSMNITGSSRALVFKLFSVKVSLQCVQTVNIFTYPPQIIQDKSSCIYIY